MSRRRRNPGATPRKVHSDLYHLRHLLGGLYFSLCSWGTYGVWSEWSDDDPGWWAKMILGIIGLAVTFGPDVKRHFRDILDYIYQIVGIDHTTGRKDSISLWTFIIIFFLIPISAIYQRFIIDRSFSDLFESHSLFYYIWNVITLLFGFIFFICALLGIPVGIIYSFAALSNWISDVDRCQFPRR